MSKKCHIVGGGFGDYTRLFQELGFTIEPSVLNDKLEPVDLIVFTGGEDVTPSLYGAKDHPTTFNNIHRDAIEQQIFTNAVLNNIPMVGICRGGQFLNVMSGGTMYQHVQGHTRSHSITDATTGEVVYVSSTHHQMMKPSSKGVLVASSTIGGEREWFEGDVFMRDVSNQDIEVVYYEETKCLCFQPHPEFYGAEYEGMKMYFKSLLERYYG